MGRKAVFPGLVVDENDRVVETTEVGGEAFYIVNDAGFRRHIPSEQVDRQVLGQMKQQVEGHEDLITEQAAKMIGEDDLFSRAIIQNQLKQLDSQMEKLFQDGIPEGGRAYLGMMGFRIVINMHGEVLRIDQPGQVPPSDGGE